MQGTSLINFVDLNDDEIRMVFAWRNDDRVAKFMKNRSVTLKEHFDFIHGLRSTTDKRYFLVKFKDDYIGVIDFIDITSDSCEFGLYANPNLKGQGDRLMGLILEYGVNILNLKKIRSCAYNDNFKAICLYEKFGFVIYDKDEKLSYLCKEIERG